MTILSKLFSCFHSQQVEPEQFQYPERPSNPSPSETEQQRYSNLTEIEREWGNNICDECEDRREESRQITHMYNIMPPHPLARAIVANAVRSQRKALK